MVRCGRIGGRGRASWNLLTSTVTLAVALNGCGLPSVDFDVRNPPPRAAPLSKVTVHNKTEDWLYVRMNWPDGFVQVARVEPGDPQYLSGAIGTSGFPRTFDVLDPQCREVASVKGLPPGSAGVLTIDGEGARLDAIRFGDTGWAVVGSEFQCGATE